MALTVWSKNRRVVGVRQEIAVLEHLHPNMPIEHDLRGERCFEDMPRRDRSNRHAARFQMILEGFPRQFKRVFEALNRAFFFQGRKHLGTVLQRLGQKAEGTVEILETLAPTDIRIHVR